MKVKLVHFLINLLYLIFDLIQMLLLLTQLTKNNTSLQKIVAFENAFDHLFEIIKVEGYADGGVVVEDCLQLMLSLLKNNPSNQTFFKEGRNSNLIMA